MKFLDRLAEKTVLGALLAVLKELRHLNHTLEVGIDSFRAVHGLGPTFAVFPEPETPASPVSRTVPRYESDEPDFLRIDILETLCREHHIAVDDSTDLIRIGREMGWLAESGEVIVLPTDYGR